jgi:glycosidase
VPVIYYGDEIGMTGAADPDNRRMMRFGNQLSETEKKMIKDVSKIIHIRKNHPALRHGDFLTLQADKNIYAYIRSDMNERILVVLNKSMKEQNVSLSLPVIYTIRKATDLISGKILQVDSNIATLIVKGNGYLMLKLE